MKRLQALILLISFNIGIIQPVLPLVQNILEGDLIEIIQPNLKVEFFCTNDVNELPDDWKSEPQEELISLDYYPVPIPIYNFLTHVILTYKDQVFKQSSFELIDLYQSRPKRPPN